MLSIRANARRVTRHVCPVRAGWPSQHFAPTAEPVPSSSPHLTIVCHLLQMVTPALTDARSADLAAIAGDAGVRLWTWLWTHLT